MGGAGTPTTTGGTLAVAAEEGATIGRMEDEGDFPVEWLDPRVVPNVGRRLRLLKK